MAVLNWDEEIYYQKSDFDNVTKKIVCSVLSPYWNSLGSTLHIYLDHFKLNYQIIINKLATYFIRPVDASFLGQLNFKYKKMNKCQRLQLN